MVSDQRLGPVEIHGDKFTMQPLMQPDPTILIHAPNPGSRWWLDVMNHFGLPLCNQRGNELTQVQRGSGGRR